MPDDPVNHPHHYNALPARKRKPIPEALGAIWEAGMNEWEKLDDPEGVLREIRGQDERSDS